MSDQVRALGAVVLLAVINCGDGVESPVDKREWSILQVLEVETRGRVVRAIEFRGVDEYDLMLVPREGDSKPVWILLNPVNPAFYKQLPEGTYRLTPEQVDQVVRERKISANVERVLRSHVPGP